MILIRSITDANNPLIASNHQPLALATIQDIIQVYGDSSDPVEAPYLVYPSSPSDLLDLSPMGLKSSLIGLTFEGGHYHSAIECHEVIRAANNSSAQTFLIPDEILSDEVRKFLREQY